MSNRLRSPYSGYFSPKLLTQAYSEPYHMKRKKV
jgi:hypothetical protein